MFALKPVSTLTCPVCGDQASETMPTDSCQYFYECTGCKTLLRPKAGDCCVFCSYGDMPCPSVQEARAGGLASVLLLLEPHCSVKIAGPGHGWGLSNRVGSSC